MAAGNKRVAMSNGQAVCVIPARLESTRLPRKLLKTIGGKPLIQWVYENAKRAKGISRVLVACDHALIKECVESFGGEAILTRATHKSGTERIAEVAERLSADIFINVQGDEPLMHSETIELVAEVLRKDPECKMSTACIRKSGPEEFRNPNAVKLTKDRHGWALYFSRAPIPHDRDGAGGEYFKHLGIYGYRRDFLLSIPSLTPSMLEDREKLEQLRVLESGDRIKVAETIYDSIGVDTQEDFDRVAKQLGSGTPNA
jgi:3-deoxy-manno-octulosonate cytidylyltransferase (CMP-KDO synthetase)